jgi:penicillin-binding protein 1A
MFSFFWRTLPRSLGLFFSLLITLFVCVSLLYVYLESQLPDVTELKDVQLQLPLQIYSSDGQLIGQFGPVRRIPVTINQIPQQLINAVLATEDERFYEHGGIDIYGLMRATLEFITTGHPSQGGSTITMQVARNFYLTRKKTISRKLHEILLAEKIDDELSKQKILELYLNKVYFGERAYGIGAAAQVYYGKTLNQLTLAQMAMLAGLPQAPSASNPIVDPDAAKKRRDHVLERMLEQGYIDQQTYQLAVAEPVNASFHGEQVPVHAPYVGEMVRDLMVASFGDDAYVNGYRVYTTVDSHLQDTADAAARTALLAYDKRHGYRGPITNWGKPPSPNQLFAWQTKLKSITNVNGLRPGAVINVNDDSASVLLASGKIIDIPWAGISWARPKINDDTWGRAPTSVPQVLKRGDIIWTQNDSDGSWWLSQVPEAQCALVSLNPQNGAITSLVGGYDYRLSSFNRVIQAQRQPGSSFKPFIYAAALDKGFTLASVINDAPIVIFDVGQGKWWRPQNDNHKFYGPTTLRVALTQSRNLVSIRLLQSIGIKYAINYITRFGFTTDQLPPNLTLALGTAEVTPLQMATGFATFANGGYRVTPFIIDHVVDRDNNIVYQSQPKVACANCIADSNANAIADDGSVLSTANAANNRSTQNVSPDQQAPQVLSPEIAYLVTSALQSVVKNGTGHDASVLNRDDIAGKTGTTQNFMDAWFDGFNSDVLATAWIGFDQPKPTKEWGAQAALPMWIQFMQGALANKPEHTMPQPPGIVTARVDPNSGQVVGQNSNNGITEYFRNDTLPTNSGSTSSTPNDDQGNAMNDQNGQPLF